MRAEQVLGAKRARELAQRAGIKTKRAKREDGYRSQLEADYAQHLQLQVHAGVVRSWRYEAVTLKLAEGARYTPDFLVEDEFGAIELHEAKGWMREAARVRLLVAAELYPWWKFCLVRRDDRGQWRIEEVG